MLVKKYFVDVTTDVAHGWKKRIVEYWIPPILPIHEGMCFNFHGENLRGLSIFPCHVPRWQMTDKHGIIGELIDNVDLDSNIVYALMDLWQIQQDIANDAKIHALKVDAADIEKKNAHNDIFRPVKMSLQEDMSATRTI